MKFVVRQRRVRGRKVDLPALQRLDPLAPGTDRAIFDREPGSHFRKLAIHFWYSGAGNVAPAPVNTSAAVHNDAIAKNTNVRLTALRLSRSPRLLSSPARRDWRQCRAAPAAAASPGRTTLYLVREASLPPTGNRRSRSVWHSGSDNARADWFQHNRVHMFARSRDDEVRLRGVGDDGEPRLLGQMSDNRLAQTRDAGFVGEWFDEDANAGAAGQGSENR